MQATTIEKKNPKFLIVIFTCRRFPACFYFTFTTSVFVVLLSVATITNKRTIKIHKAISMLFQLPIQFHTHFCAMFTEY
jgi:hypothetical protein